MSKPKTQPVYNVDRHVRQDSHTKEECDSMMATSRDKVAVAIGRQLLKRDLIKFETGRIPGPNAGEARVVVKGIVVVNVAATEKTPVEE